MALHEAAEKVAPGTFAVCRFAFGTNQMPTRWKLHVLYRIPWNYESLALGICGRRGERDTMTMLWDRQICG